MRVAVDDPRPRLLAELPVAEGDASGVLAAGLAALLDLPAKELIVVHGDGPPPAVPPTAAAVVRVVPANPGHAEGERGVPRARPAPVRPPRPGSRLDPGPEARDDLAA